MLNHIHRHYFVDAFVAISTCNNYQVNADSIVKTLFVYNKVIYEKDEALQQVEEVNGRINMVLLLVLLAMFFTAGTTKNIYVIVAGMAVIVAGEVVRLCRLPKDIKAHLTDTGRRER